MPPEASWCRSAETNERQPGEITTMFVQKIEHIEEQSCAKTSPQCSTGSWLAHIWPPHARLCQLKTWWSSIWCAPQTDRLSLTWGTCRAGRRCCHSHQPALTTRSGGFFRSKEKKMLAQKRKVLRWIYYLAKNRILCFETGAGKLSNLLIGTWLLTTKLIAWERQYLQSWPQQKTAKINGSYSLLQRTKSIGLYCWEQFMPTLKRYKLSSLRCNDK